MLSEDITLDKLIDDIDQQLEILTAIAGDNAILVEQLRLLSEAREFLRYQDLEKSRLLDLLGEDALTDHATWIDQQADEH